MSVARQATLTADELAPEIQRLRHLIPMNRLDEAEFWDLMHAASVGHISAGKPLFRAGVDDDWIFYVLEGAVEISDDRGRSFVVHGGSQEAAHPLSTHPTARCLALARERLLYVRLPVDLLQLDGAVGALGQHTGGSRGFDLEELAEGDNDIDKRIVFHVYHALMDGSFDLPALPDIAVRVREAAADDNCDAERIATIVHQDPALAAYCVRMANNAAYAGAMPVGEVPEAVVRMGIGNTCDLILAYSLSNLFQSPDATTRKLMRQAWQHSVNIANLCYLAAARARHLNGEKALLGGLLHDIGVLIVINEWQRLSPRQLDPASLTALAQELNGSLGAMVLRHWNMPDMIVGGALEPEHFTRESSRRLDLTDLVILAHLHDVAPPCWSTACPGLDALPLLERVPDATLDDDGRLVMLTRCDLPLPLAVD